MRQGHGVTLGRFAQYLRPVDRASVDLPQRHQFIKGKGYAAVLTRSILIPLRFIPVRCGFRAAP